MSYFEDEAKLEKKKKQISIDRFRLPPVFLFGTEVKVRVVNGAIVEVLKRTFKSPLQEFLFNYWQERLCFYVACGDKFTANVIYKHLQTF